MSTKPHILIPMKPVNMRMHAVKPRAPCPRCGTPLTVRNDAGMEKHFSTFTCRERTLNRKFIDNLQSRGLMPAQEAVGMLMHMNFPMIKEASEIALDRKTGEELRIGSRWYAFKWAVYIAREVRMPIQARRELLMRARNDLELQTAIIMAMDMARENKQAQLGPSPQVPGALGMFHGISTSDDKYQQHMRANILWSFLGVPENKRRFTK